MLRFTNETATVRCESLDQVLSTLHTYGVAIVPMLSPDEAKAALYLTNPLKQLEDVLHAERAFLVGLTSAQVHGDADVPKKQLGAMRFPNRGSGMLNVYGSELHKLVYSKPELYGLMTQLYPTTKTPLRIWPNRLRVQVPGGSKIVESTHFDHNMTTDVSSRENPLYGSILSLSDGRVFEYVRGTHMPAEIQRIHAAYSVKNAKNQHYIQVQ
jgi:hypothetical protein